MPNHPILLPTSDEIWAGIISDEQRITLLWQRINDLTASERIRCGFNDNGMARALAWKSDVDCPAWRVERINAVLAWSDSCWALYYQIKRQVEVGMSVPLPESLPTQCPCTFAEILMEESV